jgi:uncharacterized membrane protein
MLNPKWSTQKLSNTPCILRTTLRNFLRCGLIGWCMEIIFTALNSLRRRNMHLMGTTSLWMFPIYGSTAFLLPLFRLLKNRSLMLRGFTYMSLIFSAEFISGRLLRRRDFCPWDYGKSRYHIGRVIRLDYAPCWFGAGLLFEHMLCHTQLQDETSKISP